MYKQRQGGNQLETKEVGNSSRELAGDVIA